MRIINCVVPAAIVAPLSILPTIALAQSETAGLEEVVVTDSRATIRSTIDIKRSSTTIVDGLFATDIGDLPALSIGEALESITGATSHRTNGDATEISVRDLEPYLSATTFNGRMAANGTSRSRTNWQSGGTTDVDPLTAMTATVSQQADVNNIKFDAGVQGNES